jgi:hypothetical protein
LSILPLLGQPVSSVRAVHPQELADLAAGRPCESDEACAEK